MHAWFGVFSTIHSRILLTECASESLYSVQNIAIHRIRLIFDSSNTLAYRLGRIIDIPLLTATPYSSRKKFMFVPCFESPPSPIITRRLPPLSTYFFITSNCRRNQQFSQLQMPLNWRSNIQCSAQVFKRAGRNLKRAHLVR